MSKIITSVNSIYLIGAFGLSFLISLLATPLSEKIAFKAGAVAYPNHRSMHKKPMPLAGGIAIILGFIITISIMTLFVKELNFKVLESLTIGSSIIAVLGFFDDIYDLNARLKLLVQILAAGIVVALGTKITYITWPFSESKGLLLNPWISIPLTILWITGVTNAVNFIDGLDGLAAGVASIASIYLMFLAIIAQQPNVVAIILTATLAGTCLGFLPRNFNPAKIFMGDTGSTFIGFTLAVISIQGLFKSYTAITIIIGVILVLGLPIFDTTFAIIRRLINRKPIGQADRGHLHHRLVDRGYSQKKAVLTLYGVSGGFGLAGILFAKTEIFLSITILLIMAVLVIRETQKYKNKIKR